MLLSLVFYKEVCSHRCLFFSRTNFCAPLLLLGLLVQGFYLRKRLPWAPEEGGSSFPLLSDCNPNVPSSPRGNPGSLPWWWSGKHHQQCEEWGQRPGFGGLQGELLEVFHRASSAAAEGEVEQEGVVLNEFLPFSFKIFSVFFTHTFMACYCLSS